MHRREGTLLGTPVRLVLPVTRVDKSKTEWDEDNKVRQWTGIMPLHLSPSSLSVFFQSLLTGSYSFTPLISSSIFLSASSLFHNADTSVQSFRCHCCAMRNVALNPETSEMPKKWDNKRGYSLRSIPKVLSHCPQIAVNIIFHFWKHSSYKEKSNFVKHVSDKSL